METISNTLFWISNGLLVPVIVLLLLFFLRAILLAGGFFGEFYQRMKLQKQFAETLENITPENIDGLLQQLPSAGNSPLLRSMSKLSAHRDDDAYCEHLLANYEVEAEKELGRSRTFIKLALYVGREWIFTVFDSWPNMVPEGVEVRVSGEMLFAPLVFLAALALCVVLNLLSALIPAWYSLRKPIVNSLNEKR